MKRTRIDPKNAAKRRSHIKRRLKQGATTNEINAECKDKYGSIGNNKLFKELRDELEAEGHEIVRTRRRRKAKEKPQAKKAEPSLEVVTPIEGSALIGMIGHILDLMRGSEVERITITSNGYYEIHTVTRQKGRLTPCG